MTHIGGITARKQREQRYFNRALAGLRKQGRLSLSGANMCLYRGPDKCRCAVGFLIPDDKYDAGMESKRAYHKDILEAIGAPPEFGLFLSDLQDRLHDRLNSDLPFHIQLEKEAKAFAASQLLNYTPPLEIVSCG